MKCPRRLALLLIGVVVGQTVLLVTACGGIEAESAKWREEFALFTKTLDARVDGLALAVPGEEYRRLISAAHGPDGPEKDEARAFVKSLFGVSMDHEYEASVWFKYNEVEPLRADAFRAITSTIYEVQDWLRDGGGYNPRGVPSTDLPLTDPQVDAEIEKEVTSLLTDVFGTPQPRTNSWNTDEKFFVYDGWLVNPHYFDARRDTFNTALEARRVTAVEDVARRRNDVAKRVSALFKAGRSRAVVADDRRLTVPWPLAEPSRYIFVVIPKREFDAHPSLKVEVLTHAVSDPTKPLGRPIKVLERGDFDPARHPPVAHPVHGEAVWTAYNVTPQMTSPEAVATFEKYEVARHKLAELYQNRTKEGDGQPKRAWWKFWA
jgi:hypothetical protein